MIALAAVLAAGLAAASAIAARSGAATFADWPGYLGGPTHDSDAGTAAAITVTDAGTLAPVWSWTPPAIAGRPVNQLNASPTVYHGTVYIGANTGVFYALSEATGSVEWSHAMGFVHHIAGSTCGARGITATASVATDPVTGVAAVYVAAGDGYLYALNAATGRLLWRSVIALPSTTVQNYYDWSSPAVIGGHIYVGISSQCDHPLVRGGAAEYDQHTGAHLHTFFTVPAGTVGGSVWSSPAATAHGVWITTGNNCPPAAPGEGCSIVHLSAALKLLDSWPIPPSQQITDADFGGSPTLFTASIGGISTAMVGACNKNGIYYAWRRTATSAGPVWEVNVGAPTGSGDVACLSAAAFDGSRLYEGTPVATVGGVSVPGSLLALDPSSGAPVWQTPLPAEVLGSPSVDRAGVVAVSTYGFGGVANVTDLIDAAGGTVLSSLPTPKNSATFAQPVFADGFLLVASVSGGLTAYAPAG